MKIKILNTIIYLSVLVLFSCLGFRMYLLFQSQYNLNEVNNIYKMQIDTYKNTEIDIICIKESYPFEIKNKDKLMTDNENIFLEFKAKYTTDEAKYENLNFIGRIKIPEISIDYPIIDHVTDDLLNISICKFTGGDINQNGNLSLAGHNNKNNTMFGALDKLSIGDEIYLENMQGLAKIYNITEIFLVNPNEVWVAESTQMEYPELTLITCNSDGKKRVIYKAVKK